MSRSVFESSATMPMQSGGGSPFFGIFQLSASSARRGVATNRRLGGGRPVRDRAAAQQRELDAEVREDVADVVELAVIDEEDRRSGLHGDPSVRIGRRQAALKQAGRKGEAGRSQAERERGEPGVAGRARLRDQPLRAQHGERVVGGVAEHGGAEEPARHATAPR